MIAHHHATIQQQSLRDRIITAIKRARYAEPPVIREGDWVIVPGTYANYLALVVEVISEERAVVMLYNDIRDDWDTLGKFSHQVEKAYGITAPDLAARLMAIYRQSHTAVSVAA